MPGIATSGKQPISREHGFQPARKLNFFGIIRSEQAKDPIQAEKDSWRLNHSINSFNARNALIQD
jgi:hypothetical protein